MPAKTCLFPSTGFGSSSGPTPDARSLVDAHQFVLDFVAQQSGKPKADVLIWGHSMGGMALAEPCLSVKQRHEVIMKGIRKI